MVGKYPESLELQPVISQTQPVHLELIGSYSRAVIKTFVASSFRITVETWMVKVIAQGELQKISSYRDYLIHN